MKRLVTDSSEFKRIRLGYAGLKNNQKHAMALICFMYFLITLACSVLCSGKHEFLMDERRPRRIGQSPCSLEIQRVIHIVCEVWEGEGPEKGL